MRRNTYAHLIIKEIREREKRKQEGYISPNEYIFPDNNIEKGYVIVNYRKIELEEKRWLGDQLQMVAPTEWQPFDTSKSKAFFPQMPNTTHCVYGNLEDRVALALYLKDVDVSQDTIHSQKQQIQQYIQQNHSDDTLEDMETVKPNVCGLSFHQTAKEGGLAFFLFWKVCETQVVMGSFYCHVYRKKTWFPIVQQMITTITLVENS